MEQASTSPAVQESSNSKHAGPSIQVPPGMSKNAAKKLARKHKMEATKHERRAAERLKKKENRKARYLATQNAQGNVDAESSSKRKVSSASFNQERSKRPKNDGPKEYFDARLVIDCGFDELMAEKEASSMTQQLMYLYSANRNAKMPFTEVILTGQERSRDCVQDVAPDYVPLIPADAATAQQETYAQTEESADAVASIENNRIGKAMDGKLRGVWRRWKRVTIYKNGGIETLLSSAGEPSDSGSSVGADTRQFPSEEARQALHRIPISDAIYLTADTDDTLQELEPGKTYIIGGIVDKNRYKGLCRAKADRLGIRAAKLPLSQEMMQAVERNVRAQGESITEEGQDQNEQGFVGRKVLTVNQVVEILTAWTETRDWVKALEMALPRRKLRQRGPAAKNTDASTRKSEQAAHQEGEAEHDADADADADADTATSQPPYVTSADDAE